MLAAAIVLLPTVVVLAVLVYGVRRPSTRDRPRQIADTARRPAVRWGAAGVGCAVVLGLAFAASETGLIAAALLLLAFAVEGTLGVVNHNGRAAILGAGRTGTHPGEAAELVRRGRAYGAFALIVGLCGSTSMLLMLVQGTG